MATYFMFGKYSLDAIEEISTHLVTGSTVALLADYSGHDGEGPLISLLLLCHSSFLSFGLFLLPWGQI